MDCVLVLSRNISVSYLHKRDENVCQYAWFLRNLVYLYQKRLVYFHFKKIVLKFREDLLRFSSYKIHGSYAV